MNTRQDIAELAAFLAARNPQLAPGYVAQVALKLSRLARAATTNATNLCNIANYQAKYDRKADSLHRKAEAALNGSFSLYARVGGDPRGACLRLFSTDRKMPVRGNTMGGDEEGHAV